MLLSALAHGAPASVDKAASRRKEAQALIEQIKAGTAATSAVNRLKYLGQEPLAVAKLWEALGQSVDPRQRQSLVQALSMLGHKSAEKVLVSVLEDEDGAVRMAALQGLARLGCRCPEELRPLLSDRSMGVRREAARALGASKSRGLGKVLIAAAKSEGEPEVRAELLVAVGRLQDMSQAAAVASFLSHSSESTREAATRALCLLGDKRGLGEAKKLLASDDPLVRRQGISLLEGTKLAQAKPLLGPILNDPEPKVAAAAARTLFQAGERTMLDWLVLKAHGAVDAAKEGYEAELEKLLVSDEQRRQILKKAGLE